MGEQFVLFVGDNDGFGLGIEDGRTYTYQIGQTDFRSNLEIFATDGSQYTDQYDAFAYRTNDRLPQSFTLNFDLEGNVEAGYFGMDILGVDDINVVGEQTTSIYINGFEVFGAFNPVDPFISSWSSELRTFQFSPDMLAAINSVGSVEVTIDYRSDFLDRKIDFYAFDYFEVSGTYSDEFPAFEFNLETAAELAAAAYRRHADEDSSINTSEVTQASGEAYDYIASGQNGISLLEDGDLSLSEGVFSEGIYTNGNAAALVALADDTLVISFRGTNDIDGLPDPIDRGIQGIAKATGRAAFESLGILPRGNAVSCDCWLSYSSCN